MTVPEGRPIPPRRRPPAFNVPPVVLGLVVALALAHAARVFLLGSFDGSWWVLNLAFVPGCYGSAEAVCLAREPGAGIWSPLTYAFLHGDWTHLGFNVVWLLAFGSPVAARIGTLRTLLFCAAGSMAGAALFEVMNRDLLAPVIGASGAVSALMGGASRFAIGSPARRPGGSLIDARRPLLSIPDVLRDRTVLIFVLVFFATNILLGAGGGLLVGEEGSVAWEAHLGGFAFGFLFFGLFDPRPRGRDGAASEA